jgi:cysteine-rich repeat protein
MRTLSYLALVYLIAGCTNANPEGVVDGGEADLVEPISNCGNGMLDPNEDCDDGNAVSGDGCESECVFSCRTNAGCDDKDPCNGEETCAADHTCKPGSAVGDGTSCGAARICRGGVCVDAACGDQLVTAPEECDDANLANGDGCDACKFSCVSTDVTRNCAPADSCQGASTCNDAMHVCSPRTPVADGLACPGIADPKRYCSAGMCKTAVCNDGNLEPGETCDDGDNNETNGCRTNCTYSCSVPGTDCPAAPPCQMRSCTAQHTCMPVADPSQNGNGCGSGNVCNNGACQPPGSVCGNGMVESGEACDLGTANNTAANGCVSCQFACTMAPNSCDDMNVCNGAESCVNATVMGQAVRRCMNGTPPGNGTVCAGTNICVGGACRASMCGDGYIDMRPAFGEECEPPSTASCSASCKSIVCGNARRDPGEDCDDGNTTNLDACDSACKFEYDHRVNYLRMEFAKSAADNMFCPSSALNSAISGNTARNSITMSLDTGIANGTTNILFQFLGLDDASGTSDGNVTVGVLAGTPVMGAGYDGTNDLDWWYDHTPSTVDGMRKPTATLQAAINARTLATTMDGNVTINLLLAGAPASLRMTGTKVNVNVGTMVAAPLTSTGMTPGHLAAENLNPAFTTFLITGQQTASGAGKLCGNVSALSLAQVPMPSALVGCTLLTCSQCYTANNKLLDALVGGCNTLIGPQITSTQPDKEDPTVAAVGGGPPYTFIWSNTTKGVTGCRDRNNAMVDLQMCLADAAYSSFFKFATDRVIIK